MSYVRLGSVWRRCGLARVGVARAPGARHLHIASPRHGAVSATRACGAAGAGSDRPSGAASNDGAGGKGKGAGEGGSDPPRADDVWYEFRDSREGRPYFYQPARGRTQWERPPPGAVVEEAPEDMKMPEESTWIRFAGSDWRDRRGQKVSLGA